MPVIHDELGGCLRCWRERLTPTEAGLPAGRQRRVPGLRREELSQLAGVSPDYVARLEQGRAQRPSASVLASLARALRLSDEERAHLHRLAGAAEPGPGAINRHITPSLHRLLDRLADVPAVVADVAGETVAANPLATALMGDYSSASRRESTLAWRHFTGLPSRSVRTAKEQAEAGATIVAELHDALGRFPADEYLSSLLEDLLEVSPASPSCGTSTRWHGPTLAARPSSIPRSERSRSTATSSPWRAATSSSSSTPPPRDPPTPSHWRCWPR